MSTNDLIKKITAEMEQKYGDNKTFIQTHDLKHENNTRSIQTNSTKYIGVFENVEDAIIAAKKSQEQLMELSMKKRNEIIAAMRKTSLENAEKLAIMAHEETGFGRIEDKTIKNILAAEKNTWNRRFTRFHIYGG